VEGRSTFTSGVVRGLIEGRVPSAIEVHDWTVGPAFVSAVVNLRASRHNRREARKIAEKIVHYQKRYPGRPVHLIGHSGGGGIAVYALEALPPGHEVTGVILLGPALSPDYDLRRALRRIQGTMYNFFSPYDVGFLKVGTSIAGTMDGRHTKAAGAIGFAVPWGLSREDRQLYAPPRFCQQRYTPKMADSGHSGTHLGWARRTFVAEWVAPLINRQIETQTRYVSDAQENYPK
jgi:pimeloyl-ACP methyl ester carboxylesterase